MIQTSLPALDAIASGKDGGCRPAIEVSVVLPCLNEADTIGTCIRKAQRALEDHHLAGEVVVADNGSTDGSAAIAAELGARVIHVASRGYGHALMGGIAAARGRFIIMGDADDSYDFGDIPRFVERLRQGFDLVQGCRLPGGGGRILPGAMPFLHRWLGNPLFSFLARRMFGTPVSDIYCGLRGFTRESYQRLGLRCTGMEFATEMIIKSSLLGEKVAEIPITLHPDGRKSHPPHLRTFRDGWRTLRFFLLYSPRWLFFIPGLLLILLGLLGYAVAMPGISIGGVTPDAHTLLVASLALLLGYQSVVFAVISKTFAVREGFLPRAGHAPLFLAAGTGPAPSASDAPVGPTSWAVPGPGPAPGIHAGVPVQPAGVGLPGQPRGLGTVSGAHSRRAAKRWREASGAGSV
jgi:glycosyltransferase involved in cell wall biosynthesis